MQSARKQNSKDKKSVLSSLNLFLALIYEKMRNQSKLSTDEKFLLFYQDQYSLTSSKNQVENNKTKVCMHDKITFLKCDLVPTAFKQLKDGSNGKIYLRNIPTLLLFNLIYGRSL